MPSNAPSNTPSNMSKLALSYDENESTMPPHVLLAHQSYTTTTLSAQELQCIPLPSSAVTAAAAAATAAAAGTPATTCVLLHSCCAPCSGAMIMEMSSLGLDITVFFYNPNIHPKKEYEIRKEENKKFAAKLQIPFVDCDYDAGAWFARAKGLEYDAERGARCTMCFDMRMERTALYASENGFSVIATTNATSRWKDAVQVDESGVRAASAYSGIEYWKADWQTDRMTLLKYQISAGEKFYKQEYCGCTYSLRDSNKWREANGIPKVMIGGEEAGLGERYFTDPEVDAEEESQEVVDEFFSNANEIADAEGKEERDKLWDVYKERKKQQLSAEESGGGAGDGMLADVNNW